MFLKVEKAKDDFYFIDLAGKEELLIGKQQTIDLPIDGLILFLKKNGTWYFKNQSNIAVKRPFRRFSKRHIYPVLLQKPLYIASLTLTFIPVLPFKPYVTTNGMKYTVDLKRNTSFTIGRAETSDLVLNNPQIDRYNTRIIYTDNCCYIEDLNSSNGLVINGIKTKSKQLEDGDIIVLPSVAFQYYQYHLMWTNPSSGSRIDIRHLSKTVSDSWRKKKIRLLDDITFTIQEGEFIALVGGSGTGKSTLLDAITGRRKASSGSIYFDYNDYYRFYQSFQKNVGYVPQKDIMHDNLTVYKTLYYYSFIKMKHRLKKQELNALIQKVLTDVALIEQKNLKVSKLSGGQKKRVSIAMELMSDPKVLFLDEPTSGLSPDLDYEIMELLDRLAKTGRTVVVVTHNMENVDRCDKIAFLGLGGNLCYFGSPKKAMAFFKSKKFGPIFHLLSSKENTLFYREKFKKTEEYKKMIAEQNQYYKEEKSCGLLPK